MCVQVCVHVCVHVCIHVCAGLCVVNQWEELWFWQLIWFCYNAFEIAVCVCALCVQYMCACVCVQACACVCASVCMCVWLCLVVSISSQTTTWCFRLTSCNSSSLSLLLCVVLICLLPALLITPSSPHLLSLRLPPLAMWSLWTGILPKDWLCRGATKHWDLSVGLSVCTLYMGPLGETMCSITCKHLNLAFSMSHSSGVLLSTLWVSWFGYLLPNIILHSFNFHIARNFGGSLRIPVYVIANLR